MPRSPAARTARRTASTPRRWPSTRGSPRWAAQRPLPSMMMATWRGTPKPSLNFGAASVSGMSPCLALSSLIRARSLAFVGARRLHRHDLFFFLRERLIDLADRLVGRLLYLGGVPLLVVLAHLMLFLELLEQVDAVAPDVANRHLGGLGVFVRHLDELLAPLLVELGDAQADHLAFGRRREAEIG